MGTKTFVISEPGNLDSYALELSDLETYLNTLQTYIGTYKYFFLWRLYMAFFLGGESTRSSFFLRVSLTEEWRTRCSPSRAPQSLWAIRVAHQWQSMRSPTPGPETLSPARTGPTCGSTKGPLSFFQLILTRFTVFLERKALYSIEGVDYYKIDATNGNSNLRTIIDQLGKTSSLTSLHPDTSNMNPDDSLTVVFPHT